MASEITYAEVKFKNAPSAVAPRARPENSTSQNTPKKHTHWLLWMVLILLLLLSVFLLIGLIVTLLQKKECKAGNAALLRNSTCVLKTPEGEGQVLTCCPAGWKRFQSSCYYFSDDQMNWNASEKNCTGMGSHLVVITTKAEQDYLFKSVNGTITSQPRNYCIGLAGRETENWWHWVDKTPLKDSAAFWRKQEPSNSPYEYCVVMHVSTDKENQQIKNWNNVKCSGNYFRICEAVEIRV